MEFLGPPMDRSASDAAIDRMITLDAAGKPFFMAAERKVDGALLGFIGIKEIAFEAPFGAGHEIGWRLAPIYWGAGYASEGAKAVLAFGFEEVGLETIFSFATSGNTRSQAVMKRIGMTKVEDGDFDHPNLGPDDPLRHHVLFRKNRP